MSKNDPYDPDQGHAQDHPVVPDDFNPFQAATGQVQAPGQGQQGQQPYAHQPQAHGQQPPNQPDPAAYPPLQQHAPPPGEQPWQPSGPAPIPPKAADPASQSSSIAYTIDVLMSALVAPKKKRRKWIILAIVLAVGIAAAFILIETNVGETIAEDKSDDEAPEMSAPTWEELELVDVEVKTDPPGAHLVVNGYPVKAAKSPTTVKLAKAGPNTIIAFHKDTLPKHHFMGSGADLSGPIELELEDAEEVERGRVKFVSAVGEDATGSVLWFDGEERGSLPIIIEDIALDVLHHVLVEKEGKGNYVLVFYPDKEKADRTIPLLKEGVYIDRQTELSLKPNQKDVVISVDVGKEHFTTPGRTVADKGEMAYFEINLTDREPFMMSVHTTPIGAIDLEPTLDYVDNGEALVQFKFPRKIEAYPCFKHPGRGFCWKENPQQAQPLPAGEWDMRAYVLEDGKRVFIPGTEPIKVEADQSYVYQVNITEESKIQLAEPEVAPWVKDAPAVE